MNPQEYLSVLNPSQREAVVHEGDSLLILAGAGSGKTRVITTKIAYLISQKHVYPSSILAVTFTKKAANEMRERSVLLEEDAQYATLRTFHSWGAYFLRRYAEQAGVSKDFTVYDDDDMVTLVTKAIPSLPRKEAAVVAHKISLAKDYGILPDVLSDTERNAQVCAAVEEAGLAELLDEVFLSQYESYQKRLRATGNVDFGDLILLPYMVLRDNASIRHETHLRYRVVMVDEYQDSNVAQFLLLQQLAGVEEKAGVKVCVVGDDDQSIYKFRGAEVQNILRFQEEFPGTDIIRLETNYRSTPEILACSDKVISRNTERLGKTMQAFHDTGKKPTLIFLPTQDDETQFCADLIQKCYAKGVPYSDWAILYRTNAQSLGFESDFLKRKIPYTIVGSLKFYEREEIKDALSWLAFIVNQRDEISFRRIINKPARGIGAASQDKIVEASLGESLLEGIEKIKLSKKASEGAKSFSKLVKDLLSSLPDEIEKKDDGEKKDEVKLSSFIEKVIEETGLEEYHRAQDEVSGTQKVMNLEELVNGAVLYPCTKQGLLDFLDSIELDRSLEEKSDDAENDSVTLITLHNTKGLEFPRVIITGMEYGVFPRENKTGSELEEERRLFYVGITRAKTELYFTSCGMRRLYGRTSYMQPSPFLSELGKDNIRILGQKPSLFNADSEGGAEHPYAKKWHKGASVFHDDWGHGQIIKAEKTDEGEWLITVAFENGGLKKFLPQYQSASLTLEE